MSSGRAGGLLPVIIEATPFLNFNGNCSEAIELYRAALGAEVEARMPWSPEMFDDGKVPEAMKDGVMYARILLGKVPLELSDVPPHMTTEPGTNHTVNLHISDPGELDQLFEALGEGGKVSMPPENMFWGARYGALTDRFGIRWSLHCQLTDPSA